MILDSFRIREVLCYNSIKARTLNAGECIVIHQHMQQGHKLSPKLESKIAAISQLIDKEKWVRPIVQYNADRQLEIHKQQ